MLSVPSLISESDGLPRFSDANGPLLTPPMRVLNACGTPARSSSGETRKTHPFRSTRRSMRLANLRVMSTTFHLARDSINRDDHADRAAADPLADQAL